MKAVEINTILWSLKSLYKESKTPELRALFGYMLKTGNTNNPTLGGAFSVLRDIQTEIGPEELYCLVPRVSRSKADEIINIVEATRAGCLDEFALKQREIDSILKYISDFI